ncbi:hypothetical protein [Nocardioides sp.]|uniref:hypothetical protein n=1 Tax=Nocardioides sp. TaxID=35761 RepID=UPI002EDA482C
MPRAPIFVVSLAAALVLAGCGTGGDGSDASTRQPTSHASRSPAAPPTTSGGPDHAASQQPSAPPSSSAHRHRRHKVGALQPRMRLTTAAHLLDADTLPALDERTWTVADTGPEDPEQDAAVGACQKTVLDTIGAIETVRRSFTAPGRAGATQVVARFADARSAWRAHQVLISWQEDCAERVGGTDVGPVRSVTVAAGTGDAYRTAAGRRASGLGILRSGPFLTLVEVTTGDDDYPDRRDPARAAVRRIARTF